MEQKNFILIPFPIEQFKELVNEAVENSLRAEFLKNASTKLPKKNPDDELWKIADVAKYFKVTKATIYTWIKDGIIPAPSIRRKSRVFYKKEEIINSTPKKK
jgi:excisionase family DNA binding protein